MLKTISELTIASTSNWKLSMIPVQNCSYEMSFVYAKMNLWVINAHSHMNDFASDLILRLNQKYRGIATLITSTEQEKNKV